MAIRGQIAGWVGVAAEAAESAGEFDRVSSIEAATATSIVFATDAGTLASALASPAGLVLAASALEPKEGEANARVLWVRDARYGFAEVAQRLAERSRGEIHAAAVVSAS